MLAQLGKQLEATSYASVTCFTSYMLFENLPMEQVILLCFKVVAVFLEKSLFCVCVTWRVGLPFAKSK